MHLGRGFRRFGRLLQKHADCQGVHAVVAGQVFAGAVDDGGHGPIDEEVRSDASGPCFLHTDRKHILPSLLLQGAAPFSSRYFFIALGKSHRGWEGGRVRRVRGGG